MQSKGWHTSATINVPPHIPTAEVQTAHLSPQHGFDAADSTSRTTAGAHAVADEEDEDTPQRASVVSYCKLDYPTLLEATQLRLHRLRANLRKGTEDRHVQALGWGQLGTLCRVFDLGVGI